MLTAAPALCQEEKSSHLFKRSVHNGKQHEDCRLHHVRDYLNVFSEEYFMNCPVRSLKSFPHCLRTGKKFRGNGNDDDAAHVYYAHEKGGRRRRRPS